MIKFSEKIIQATFNKVSVYTGPYINMNSSDKPVIVPVGNNFSSVSSRNTSKDLLLAATRNTEVKKSKMFGLYNKKERPFRDLPDSLSKDDILTIINNYK